jgi:hypothetical protein
MKVYVLLYDNGYDGYDFHGVYSTEGNTTLMWVRAKYCLIHRVTSV